MDPLTLFALANGAVSAVKAGCKLYKDIKGAAGEVKDVLKDLDQQFAKLHPPEKPPTTEQKNALIKEKNRVIELNKRDGDLGHEWLLCQYTGNFTRCLVYSTAIMQGVGMSAENVRRHVHRPPRPARLPPQARIRWVDGGCVCHQAHRLPLALPHHG